jgi:hypothetical protein
LKLIDKPQLKPRKAQLQSKSCVPSLQCLTNHSFCGVNDKTRRLAAPEEAMLFGQAFQQLLEGVVDADQ